MNAAVVGAVLGASLLGSPHCAGMCGGFVYFYAASADPRRRGRIASHAAYNGARLLSYAFLGAVAGTLGERLDRAGAWAGIGRAAALVAGVLMVAWGLAQLATLRGLRLPRLRLLPEAHLWLRQLLARTRERSPVLRAAAVGLLTAVLPCGWLWAFVVTAGGTGSVTGGVLVMAAFWAGTLPIMAALGLGVQRVFGPLRRRLPVISAAAIVVVGLVTIGARMRPRTGHAARHAAPSMTAPAIPGEGAPQHGGH